MGVLKQFFSWTIRLLREQRGEAGEGEQFTPEELAILGEDTGEEGSEGESSEGEGGSSEEEGEGEAEGDGEGESAEGDGEEEEEAPVISESAQQRIDTVIGREKETNRKLDLLKRLGPDEYFKVYPDEKPAAAHGTQEDGKTTITEPAQDRVLSFEEAQGMVIDGGTHNRKTLGDLYKENPIAAQDIYLNYRDEQHATIDQKKASETTRKQAVESELNEFSSGISKQMFEKDLDALTAEEGKKIDDVVTSVMDWMEQSGRFHYKLEDAFMIMSKDDLLATAKSDGAKALIKQLKGESTPSIKANKGSGVKKTGYEAYGSMSRDELAAKVDNMSDVEFAAFSNKAPQSLKDKFGDIPWA